MNINITLYYADWCGHCVNFKSEWNKLKKRLDGTKIKCYEYESSTHPTEIKKANINGFPTIKITKNNETYDYIGERTMNAILKELNEQSGGTNNNYYKYYKNKNKYLKCKK